MATFPAGAGEIAEAWLAALGTGVKIVMPGS
jgi:hypothetical protein